MLLRLSPPSRRDRGHALLVTVIAMSILTIGAVAGATAANHQVAMTGVMGTQRHLLYAATAGLDHAAHLLEDPGTDLRQLMRDLDASPDGCLRDWIGGSEAAAHDADPIGAGGQTTGEYSVDLCLLSCTPTLAGEQLGGADTGQNALAVSFDAVATGYRDGSTQSARMAAVLVGTFVGESCGLR